MKGSFTLIGATAAGFVGVLVLHSTPSQAASLSKASSATSSAVKSKSSSQATQAASTQAASTPTPSTTLAVSANVNGSAIGKQENYGYGQMAIKVTISNNRIVDVSVSSIQALESYSLQLEQQVTPILKAEVLKAQSASISSISGATYTSEAYAYSLQSALDQLHFK